MVTLTEDKEAPAYRRANRRARAAAAEGERERHIKQADESKAAYMEIKALMAK
jgi:hypothetical protein